MHCGIPTRRAGAAIALVALLYGCGAPVAPGRPGDRIPVVAAENFWGSLAAQLGGERVTVTNVITNPDADPHAYEPTASDARAFANARLVVFNGVGYDPWAPKLLAADAPRGRVVLNVGDVVGARTGTNPHRWYAPADVLRVIDGITAGYKRLAPAEGAYFDHRHSDFVSTSLRPYLLRISAIRTRYAGTPVGASESIFVPLADALGLDLRTPIGFLNAISEGSDPTSADKATVDRQMRSGAIKVYVFNSQNSTPDVKAELVEAKAAGIPVAPITETLSPRQATFQDWQDGQLQHLELALAQATGR